MLTRLEDLSPLTHLLPVIVGQVMIIREEDGVSRDLRVGGGESERQETRRQETRDKDSQISLTCLGASPSIITASLLGVPSTLT